MSMGSWKARLVGAAAAGGVLAAGLLLGQPEADANVSGARRSLGPPPALAGQAEVPLGEGLNIWGNPAQLSLFWTGDSPEQVIRTYFEAWKDAGFDPQINELDQVSNVWFVDPSTGLMRSVTVLRQGEDTLVLPGVSDARFMPDPTARNAPVPVPENATAYLAHAADDTHSLSYSASFVVPISPARSLEFYKVELGKLGYDFSESLSKTSKAMHGEFRRGPELVTVAASQSQPDDEKTSFVYVSHVRDTSEWQ